MGHVFGFGLQGATGPLASDIQISLHAADQEEDQQGRQGMEPLSYGTVINVCNSDHKPVSERVKGGGGGGLKLVAG